MKPFRLVLLCLSAAVVCAVRAQDDQQQQKAPTEIPDFNNLDEYIYVPKSTMNFGFRYIGGVKTHFSGTGTIVAPEAILDPSAPNVSRTYHDGSVQPDTRTLTNDNGNGTANSAQIPSDGKTNTWNYTDPGQATADGFMNFNIYSANTTDAFTHNTTGRGTLGMELSAAHDMRRFNKHFEWKLFGGMSINDIQGASQVNVTGTLYTTTDTYDLFGQTAPPAPFSSSSSSTSTVTLGTDASGNPITQTINTAVLLGNVPLTETKNVPSNTTPGEIFNHYKLHGAYATFRGGPQLVYDFNDHLHLIFSAGPAIIMAGSTYTVTEVLTPPTGAQIVDTLQNTTNKLVFGVYADAGLQYDLTDRAGFYFGAFDQDAGGYKETASTGSSGGLYTTATGSGTGAYTAKVDFNNQQGLRAGMAYKF